LPRITGTPARRTAADAARELAGVRKLLPVCRAAQNSPALLAAEIVRNYKEFAVETRA
jgi:hypothetical protein